MACITISIEKQFKERLSRFPWVNWSEIGREEILKRYTFEKYIKTGKLTKEENEFCEKIDWHPVDELPLKDEFIKERITYCKCDPVLGGFSNNGQI